MFDTETGEDKASLSSACCVKKVFFFQLRVCMNVSCAHHIRLLRKSAECCNWTKKKKEISFK